MTSAQQFPPRIRSLSKKQDNHRENGIQGGIIVHLVVGADDIFFLW